MTRVLLAVSMLLVVASGAAAQALEDPQTVLNRAVTDFEEGRIDEALLAFDELIELMPDVAPGLWQRGIALYYAGRYSECREQFEAHRTVNRDNIETVAWHFFCAARERSAADARRGLLPVSPNPGLPLRHVYELLRGAITPEELLAAPGTDPVGRFYAHLYAGLYFEAVGDRQRAMDHLTVAAGDENAAAGGYMHSAARVHVRQLRAGGTN